MKVSFILIIACSGIWYFTTSPAKSVYTVKKSVFASDSIDFKTQIHPILVKKCSPCHFPGGKLYKSLPFDKSETLLNHKDGIMKRFGTDEESQLISNFLSQSTSVN